MSSLMFCLQVILQFFFFSLVANFFVTDCKESKPALFGIQSQVLQSSTTKVVEYFILPCSLHNGSHFYVLRSSDTVDKPKAHVKCNLFPG